MLFLLNFLDCDILILLKYGFSNNLNLEQQNGVLCGKLFAIKDNINVKGYPTTCSSAILKDHISIFNSTVINRIDQNGGLIVAKTNLDEFAMGSSNEYSIFGESKNPINEDYVCGGSSGGSSSSSPPCGSCQ